MLTEQGAQPNYLETKCIADTLILYILKPTPLAGCQSFDIIRQEEGQEL